jgi:hypothetical protein
MQAVINNQPQEIRTKKLKITPQKMKNDPTHKSKTKIIRHVITSETHKPQQFLKIFTPAITKKPH